MCHAAAHAIASQDCLNTHHTALYMIDDMYFACTRRLDDSIVFVPTHRDVARLTGLLPLVLHNLATPLPHVQVTCRHSQPSVARAPQ
jgi:hypothetical protein